MIDWRFEHKWQTILTFILAIAVMSSSSVFADDNAPWGGAELLPTEYGPPKVVYDVAVNTADAVDKVLDRASYLHQITGSDPFESSIVLVLHGPEIDFFAKKNYAKNKALMQRAQSLTVGGGVIIRMCKIAAQGRGFHPGDIHGFVELVPMGDAEIVRLQTEENHAYMR